MAPAKYSLATSLSRVAARARCQRVAIEVVIGVALIGGQVDRLVLRLEQHLVYAAERVMSGHVALRAEQANDLIARWKTRRKADAVA